MQIFILKNNILKCKKLTEVEDLYQTRKEHNRVNANMIILGTSGSGKSTAAKLLLRTAIRNKFQWIPTRVMTCNVISAIIPITQIRICIGCFVVKIFLHTYHIKTIRG